jgi:hypothetical protein
VDDNLSSVEVNERFGGVNLRHGDDNISFGVLDLPQIVVAERSV